MFVVTVDHELELVVELGVGASLLNDLSFGVLVGKLDVDIGAAMGIIVGVISGIAITLMLANTKEIWNKKAENEISLKSEN